MNNWLLIIVATIFIVCIVVGYVRGFLKLGISLLSTVITMIIVLFLSPYVADALAEYTPVDEYIEARVVEAFIPEITQEDLAQYDLSGTPFAELSPEQMQNLTDELRVVFDYILLDCPAGIEQGFRNAIAGADRAIVVTTPEVSAIRDADRIIGLLEANELNKTELIVNRLRMDMVKRGDMMSVDDVCDILAIPILGVVPDDENIVISTNQGVPLVGSNCLAGQAYANICRRILGETVEFLNLEEKQGVFNKLKNLFRKN